MNKLPRNPRFRRGGVLVCMAMLIGLCLWPSIARAADFPALEPGYTSSTLLPSRGKTDKSPGFRMLSALQTGIVFTNTFTDAAGASNRTLYNGSGVAAGDFDGDGLPDLVFARIEGGVALFRNLGDWRFTNVTEQAGLGLLRAPCRGVVLADVTGDGALDLLVAVHGAGLHCWQNTGRGLFANITAKSRTADNRGAMTIALADVDGNGSVDIYVANNRTDDMRDRGMVELRMAGGRIVVPAELSNRLVIINGQPHEFGEPDRLLLNSGDGRFHDASWTDGTFLDEAGRPLAGPPLDWGLTATFRDLNSDGSPDIYVCNDFWTPDRIWLNDGKGHFRAASTLSFRQTSSSSMGVDMADLDADGLPEIFVVDMLSRFPSWRKRQLAAQPSFFDPPGLITNRPQILRNTLFHARRDGTYAEIAEFAGLAASEWAWQPLFIDVDLDGHQDLLISTGHLHDFQDRDAEALVQSRQRSYQAIRDPAERQRAFRDDLLANIRLYPPLETPIVAFRNRRNFQFEDATAIWGTDAPGVHHGIAAADFDGDGDLDLAVNNMNSSAALYRNETLAPRIAVRLRGLPPNTQAVGAHVTLRGAAIPAQIQEVVAGGRYLSGSDPLLVFAAGEVATNRTLEIRWRNGSTRTLQDLQPGRLYAITQDPRLDRPERVLVSPQPLQPIFKDVSDRLAHVHKEIGFDDFARQPLLPWRLSQLGPGVAWADLDRDGWEDLIVGTGAGGTLGAFKNNRGASFTRWTEPPFAQGQARDTAGIAAFPAEHGRSALLAVAANYEDSLTNAACLLEFGLGQPAPRPLLRDGPSSAGPLALADIDADGDLDLFIGARVTRARWPEASGSRILRREGGSWVTDEPNTAQLAATGCVSSAIWTDLNRDGYPDLVLAGEWGPLKIFRNDRGRLAAWEWRVQTNSQPGGPQQLSELSGLWISVAAGDFDGDGQIDLIAGNWGENSSLRATLQKPLTLVAGSWRNEGSLALIETDQDPARSALTPSRPMRELLNELPFLAGRFASARSYAEAALEEVLAADETRAPVRSYSAATLASLLLLNRAGIFEIRTLPFEAQLSPVFGVAVADFDANGTEDVFLAQNFFATRPGVPRLDGGRGLLLLGNGNGNLHPMPGDQSGLSIDGEQRGTAVCDFNHDGRMDLVVTQNGAPTRLFLNAAPAAGVRIKVRGGPGNPDGIGCLLRLGHGGHLGPAQEIHAGSGYWAQDSPARVLSRPPLRASEFLELEVLWPGGELTTHKFPATSLEYTASTEVRP